MGARWPKKKVILKFLLSIFNTFLIRLWQNRIFSINKKLFTLEFKSTNFHILTFLNKKCMSQNLPKSPIHGRSMSKKNSFSSFFCQYLKLFSSDFDTKIVFQHSEKALYACILSLQLFIFWHFWIKSVCSKICLSPLFMGARCQKKHFQVFFCQYITLFSSDYGTKIVFSAFRKSRFQQYTLAINFVKFVVL